MEKYTKKGEEQKTYFEGSFTENFAICIGFRTMNKYIIKVWVQIK